MLRGYELDKHETVLLREACRTADSLDALQAVLTNAKPADEALKQAQREADRILRPYKR